MESTGPTPPMERNVEGALQDAATAIGVARTLLDQGNIIDLEGLEAHVEQACSAIPGLATSDKEKLKPALVALIDGLNTLSEQLSDQHRRISGSLQDIGTRHRAVSAYKPRGSR